MRAQHGSSVGAGAALLLAEMQRVGLDRIVGASAGMERVRMVSAEDEDGGVQFEVVHGEGGECRVELPPGWLSPGISACSQTAGYLQRLDEEARHWIRENQRMQALLRVVDAQYGALMPERGQGDVLWRRVATGATVAARVCDQTLRLFVDGRAVDDAASLGAALVATAAADAAECGICYGTYVCGQPASVTCENGACGRAYHAECLRTWFRMDPQSRGLFGRLMGPCLFCNKTCTV